MNGQESDVKIKSEGGHVGGRLSSFKAPRDLTLGAPKPPSKKVFVPNLNVVRNKNKSNVNNIESSERRRDVRGSAPRGGRGPGDRMRPTIVKAGGVFSEGVAASARHASSRSYGSREARDEPQTMQKPTIKPMEQPKVNRDDEIQQIKELTNDEEDVDLLAEHFGPTRLPISKHCDILAKNPIDDVDMKPPKLDIMIKTEPMDEDNMKTMSEDPPERKPDRKIKMEYNIPSDAQNLFKNPSPTLLLLQFPDSLPGRGPADDESVDSKNNKEAQPSGDNNLGQKPKINICTAKHLEEGQIGKIQIYKSGKIKMVIGNTQYDLSLGTQACFRQDVISVNVDSEQRSGNVINLGPIQSKITVTPNWETMFQQMETN